MVAKGLIPEVPILNEQIIDINLLPSETVDYR